MNTKSVPGTQPLGVRTQYTGFIRCNECAEKTGVFANGINKNVTVIWNDALILPSCNVCDKNLKENVR